MNLTLEQAVEFCRRNHAMVSFRGRDGIVPEVCVSVHGAGYLGETLQEAVENATRGLRYRRVPA